MPTLRRDIVDSQNPGVYHCISRCVRRESLLSSPDRRRWIVQRIERLVAFLAIDVISFAVMENHLHLLLRIRPDIVRSWSDREVATRRIAVLPNKRSRSRNGIAADAEPTEQELSAILSNPRLLERARRDLSDLGFFHRLLKEPSARMWNEEDGVTGHFWEGRFRSPRVLDDASLLRVSRYIELNEIRARAADSVPSSIWTSARNQWMKLVRSLGHLVDDRSKGPEALDNIVWEPVFPCCSKEPMAVRDGSPHECEPRKPLIEYLLELDLLGRSRHPAKPGFISSTTRGLLEDSEAALIRAGHAAASAREYLRDAFLVRLRSLTLTIARALPQESPERRSEPHYGSCYGDANSVSREANRRSAARLIPILILE